MGYSVYYYILSSDSNDSCDSCDPYNNELLEFNTTMSYGRVNLLKCTYTNDIFGSELVILLENAFNPVPNNSTSLDDLNNTMKKHGYHSVSIIPQKYLDDFSYLFTMFDIVNDNSYDKIVVWIA
jgi:hypothetical protein